MVLAEICYGVLRLVGAGFAFLALVDLPEDFTVALAPALRGFFTAAFAVGLTA